MTADDLRYSIARTASKALKRRTTMYATGPTIEGNAAKVMVTMDGRRYELTVKEVEGIEVTDARCRFVEPHTQGDEGCFYGQVRP